MPAGPVQPHGTPIGLLALIRVGVMGVRECSCWWTRELREPFPFAPLAILARAVVSGVPDVGERRRVPFGTPSDLAVLRVLVLAKKMQKRAGFFV